MIPAEIFPTRYRATCHGISAAIGKLGSILAQVFSEYYGLTSTEKLHSGWGMFVFGACMVVGAIVSHFLVPTSTCHGRIWGGQSETLENLALGRMQEKSRYNNNSDNNKRTERRISHVGLASGKL